MYTKKDDGLSLSWIGRTWLNPPYSNVLPWITKMAEHNNGFMLVYARSTDAVWGQLALKTCSAAYFLAGRILFYYPNGEPSEGKWCSNMLLAYGEESAKTLLKFSKNPDYPGQLMRHYK